MPGACDVCLQDKCCQELADCADDIDCMNCVFGVLPSPPECSQPKTAAALTAFSDCVKANCPGDCAPADQCNPVTNNGCSVADMAGCELVYPGMFVCIPPFGAPVPLCGQCNNITGPYCGSGLHCYPGLNTCARYCCADTDCGTGRCELDPMKAFGATIAVPGDAVGLCVTMDGTAAACDAPAQSVSGGVCFAGYPPM